MKGRNGSRLTTSRHSWQRHFLLDASLPWKKRLGGSDCRLVPQTRFYQCFFPRSPWPTSHCVRGPALESVSSTQCFPAPAEGMDPTSHIETDRLPNPPIIAVGVERSPPSEPCMADSRHTALRLKVCLLRLTIPALAPLAPMNMKVAPPVLFRPSPTVQTKNVISPEPEEKALSYSTFPDASPAQSVVVPTTFVPLANPVLPVLIPVITAWSSVNHT